MTVLFIIHYSLVREAHGLRLVFGGRGGRGGHFAFDNDNDNDNDNEALITITDYRKADSRQQVVEWLGGEAAMLQAEVKVKVESLVKS